uniref:Si:ch211-234p6.9 n=1 Tax=Cyprinus carpio TaxID=7962 RepID=A0A8C1ZWN4_CYPCA
KQCTHFILLQTLGLGGKVLLFPTKTNTSFVKLTPEKPLSLSAFTLCMHGEVDELNVWREKDGRLSLYIQSSEDGTHLCVTWDFATGLTASWVDGHHSLFKIYRKGHSIRPGGTVLLGQDPDAYVSTFDRDQSFVGEITDVHMWDHVLSGSQIKVVYSNQELKENVFDWNTIRYDIRGDVLVVNES